MVDTTTVRRQMRTIRSVARLSAYILFGFPTNERLDIPRRESVYSKTQRVFP